MLTAYVLVAHKKIAKEGATSILRSINYLTVQKHRINDWERVIFYYRIMAMNKQAEKDMRSNKTLS